VFKRHRTECSGGMDVYKDWEVQSTSHSLDASWKAWKWGNQETWALEGIHITMDEKNVKEGNWNKRKLLGARTGNL